MRAEQGSIIRPVAEPVVLDAVYSEDQHRRLVNVVREHGPWSLILAQHFASADEVLATMSGSMPEGIEPTMDMFLTPVFRGSLAQGGTCLYPELEDVFFNSQFLEYVRNYWKAKYARPEMLLFNIQGPCGSHDPGHLDAVSFRGATYNNTPIWLLNTMGKSGLFKRWLLKKAQVITWFYQSNLGGGFTYWPDGPAGSPKRLATPMWNKGVVVQNEMMFHRGESNGPVELQHPQGLAFESVFGADPQSDDGWQISTGDKVIQRLPASEVRFLVHWSAEVYGDMDEMKAVMDHTDDLSHEKIVDIFMADLKARGVSFVTPSDPLHDPAFIRVLGATYDSGNPRIYPEEAPGPAWLAAS